MESKPFQTLTRRAVEGISRRASLMALGGAALAASNPVASEAEGGQSCGKKLKKRCNQNKTQCNTNGAILCKDDADCLATITFCCNECFSSGFVSCLAASVDA